MPRTRRYVKRRSNTRFRKRSFRRTRSRRGTFKKRSVFITSRSKLVKLKYMDQSTQIMAFTGNNYNVNGYNLNNAYDVNPILGSTAMAGFAEWQAFYERYRVMGVSANIRMANCSSTAGGNTIDNMFVVGWYVAPPDTTSPAGNPISSWTTAMDLQMNPNSTSTMLPYSSTAGYIKKLKRYTSFSKLIGDKASWNSGRFDGYTNAAPAIQIQGWLWAATLNNNNATGTILFNVIITFYVKFFEKSTLYS